jgi:hypothetical protein
LARIARDLAPGFEYFRYARLIEIERQANDQR